MDELNNKKNNSERFNYICIRKLKKISENRLKRLPTWVNKLWTNSVLSQFSSKLWMKYNTVKQQFAFSSPLLKIIMYVMFTLNKYSQNSWIWFHFTCTSPFNFVHLLRKLGFTNKPRGVSMSILTCKYITKVKFDIMRLYYIGILIIFWNI